MNGTLDHKVSTVPSNATVCDESQDLRMGGLAMLVGNFRLLAFEQYPACTASFDVSNEVMELPNRSPALHCFVLCFFTAVL
jgi:hypothetical protein